MSITLDGSNGITTPMYNGAVTNQVTPSVSMKNRIINGAMVIDQRNAGASVTASNTGAEVYTIDRWFYRVSQASKMSIQQSSTAPAGFNNSVVITSLSAYTIGATDFFDYRQAIEGYNVADLNWGTANAKTITISFWVRSSLTGTFGGSVFNYDYDRSYPFTYSISSANTWEQKSITIAGDQTGTWYKTNAGGMTLSFALGDGSNYQGTVNTWQSGFKPSTSGCTSLVGTNGATFYITGVQLEVGSSATSFDYRPYGTEFALCQRYYSEVGKQLVGRCESTGIATMVCSTPMKMRTSATASTITTTNAIAVPGISSNTITGIAAQSATDNAVYISFNSSSLTSGTTCVCQVDRVLGLSAEL